MIDNRTGYTAYQLREMARFGRVASIYCDPENPDYFIAGFVLASNLKTASIRSVSPTGHYDGLYALRIAQIDEVLLDIAYADKLELLLKLNGETAQPIEMTDDCDHVQELLHRAMAEKRCVSVWTSEEIYSGFVDDLNDLTCSLRALDLMGVPFPPMTIRLSDIFIVSVDSEEERTYERLYRYNARKER